MPKTRWYRDGLKFACTECGNCCTGPPGYVWLTTEEIERISVFTGLSVARLGKRHVRRVGTRYSLTERGNGDCVFLQHENDRRYCSIYPVRPLQCRTYPFWTVNLESRVVWQEVAKECPGMNQGEHHSLEQIESIRTTKSWQP